MNPRTLATAKRKQSALLRKISSGKSTPEDVRECKKISSEIVELTKQMFEELGKCKDAPVPKKRSATGKPPSPAAD